MKKNTLLYLDENLVELAKNTGLNISQITEDTLRSHLAPIMSVGERQLDFEGHLKDLKKEGRYFFLSFHIKEIRLENIRKFDSLNIRFKDGLNVIYGMNASGKSTIIEAIARTFQFNPPFPAEGCIKHTKNKGEITLIFSPTNSITTEYVKMGNDSKEYRTTESIFLDEPVQHLDKEGKVKFIKWLKKKFDCQIILATHDEDFAVFADNIIKLGKSQKGLEDDINHLCETRVKINKEILVIKNRIHDLKKELEKIEILESKRMKTNHTIKEIKRVLNKLKSPEDVKKVEIHLEKLKYKEIELKKELQNFEEKSIKKSLDKLYRELDRLTGDLFNIECEITNKTSILNTILGSDFRGKN